MSDSLLGLFLELVRIDSPSGMEENIRKKLLREFADLGIAGEIDRRGNLKFFIPGTIPGAARLFSAHMDTVQPCRGVKPWIDGEGNIRSDGTTVLGADDKDGIASLLHAARQVIQNRLPHPPLELLFTVSEECDLDGSRHLDPGWLQSEYGWVFDGPGETGTVYINGVAKKGFRIQVCGRAAHAAICPEQGCNAIQTAAGAMMAFPPGRRGGAVINYGTISGGSADNVVPETAVLTVEIRSGSQAVLQQTVEDFQAAWQNTAREFGSKARMEETGAYPGFALSANADFVVKTLALLKQCGLPAGIQHFQAGSDANYLNSLGIPCCVLAMGRRNNHTNMEVTTEKNLENMSLAALTCMTHDLRLTV